MGAKDSRKREMLKMLDRHKVPEQVIQAYGLAVEDIQPVGKVWRLVTDRGLKALKKVPYDEGRINLMHTLMEHLAHKGFDRIPRLIRNRYRTHYIRRNNDYFLLADWVEGCKCDFRKQEDLLQAVEELAKFHQLARGIEIKEGLKLPERNNWLAQFSKRENDLKQFCGIASTAGKKKVFNRLYLDHYAYFAEQAQTSLNILSRPSYQNLLEEAKENNPVCHKNYVEDNLIIDKRGRMHILNFDNVGYELRIYDLGSLLQKIMIRNKWDFDLGLAIIQAYEGVSALSAEELEVLLGVLYFPHQTWICANRFFRRQKGLEEQALIRQFKNIINTKRAKEDFLAQFGELVTSRKEAVQNEEGEGKSDLTEKN